MRRLLTGIVWLGLASLPTATLAIPRYTARYQQSCTLCHQNPTGGGLRSLYASQFLVPNEMVLRKPAPEKIERIHPDISSSVTVGTDLRVIHLWADDANRPERNFFQMQGDLYLAFSIDERFSANVNVDQVGSTEIYGLAWVLPWSGYVKAGRFTPVFGWKFPDHNMFTREELWFDQPYNTDAGIEIGFYPKHVAFWASVLNGEPGSNTRFDSNREVAVVGGALAQFHLGPVGCGVGGSVWHNQKEPTGGRTGERNAGGPFGYFNWGRASWLWEVDESRLTVPSVSSKTAFLTSHEVSFQVRPGFDVLGTYNYADPDLDVQSGVRERYGLGVEVIPVPFVELQGTVNMYLTQTGVDVTEDDFVRTEVQLHLFY